jgi:hypothetical protein
MSDSTSFDPCDAVPNCPVCNGPLTVAHHHFKTRICICRLCGTSLSIPDDAFLKARLAAKAAVTDVKASLAVWLGHATLIGWA